MAAAFRRTAPMAAASAQKIMSELEPAASKFAPRTPGFTMGKKQLFMPSHVITFLRKEHLPPNEACFRVPLTFTKFDLRDYLWNLYNVQVSKVRSHVRQVPLVQRVGRPNSWYRPQPQKIMIVELVKPFQWPEVPDNLSAWQKELWDMREKMIDSNQEANMNVQRGEIPLQADKADDKARKELRKRAQALLKGEEKWENDVVLDPKWEHILDNKDSEKMKPYKSGSLPSVEDIREQEAAEEKALDSQLAAIKEANEIKENEKKD